MKTITKTSRKYIILFFALLVLCWLFPYTGDDWAWGSSIGIERLNTMFEGYNGRYLGNFIVMLLTRSNILKTAAMALTITAIVKCIEIIGRTGCSFYYACIFLLLTPKALLKQAIVWTSGFSNYCTSIALILVFLVFAIRNEEAEGTGAKWLYTAGLLLLGFANSLIVEHVTLYSAALALGLCIYSFATDKKNLVQYIGYFAGAAAGAVMMFSNSGYHIIAEGQDYTRSVAKKTTLLQTIYDNYIHSIYCDGFFKNVMLNISLLVLALMLYIMISKTDGVRPGQKKCMVISLSVFGIFVIYSTFSKIMIPDVLPGAYVLFNSVFAFASLAAFLTYVLLAGCILNDLRRTLILSISIILVIAPLFVVTPIGGRCYFASYVMFITMGCTMLDHIAGEKEPDPSLLTVLSRTAILTIYVIYLSIFATISASNAERLRMARTAAEEGKKTVVFTVLPFDSFLWNATPTEGIWADRYKLFYDLPADLAITVKERKQI